MSHHQAPAPAGPANGALSVEALRDMFPSLSPDTISDIVTQCNDNIEVALSKLLSMTAVETQHPPQPPAAMPQTRQGQLAMLFPGEKIKSGIVPHRTQPSSTRPALNPGNSTLQGKQASLGLEEMCPWLVSLDTGQQHHHHHHHEWETTCEVDARSSWPTATTASATPASKAGSRPWWPCWPLTSSSGKPGATPKGSSAGTTGGNHHQHHNHQHPSLPLPIPPPALPLNYPTQEEQAAGSQAPGTEGQPSEDEQLLGVMPHLAHILSSPQPSGASSPATTPPLHYTSHQALHAGSPPFAPVPSAPPAASTPLPLRLLNGSTEASACDADLEAALAASQLSEPGVPVQQHQGKEQQKSKDASQRQQQQQQEGMGGGYSATDLILAVDFYAAMFPSMKAEVVGDVLQRYCDAPQTALEQLIMLSSCVADADAADPSLPDRHAWEASSASGSGSGSGSEEDQVIGSSWEQALSPSELAAMPADLLLPAQLESLHQQEAQQQQAQQAQQQQQAQQPSVEDDLPLKEKAKLLQAEFKSASAADVSASLAACDGSLFAAAELLAEFAAEDAAASASSGRPTTAGSDGGNLNAPSAAAAAATVPAAAAGAEVPASAASTSQHVSAKVQHLCKRFPGVSSEALEVALVGCNYSLADARRTLRQAGCEEVELESSTPTQSPKPIALPRVHRAHEGLVAAQRRILPPVPAPDLNATVLTAAAGPLSLSQATHQRNQAIFEQERAQAQRLQQCYRRCFELAAAAHARGDRASADDLRERGHQYRQQYDDERRKASRRISKRVNAGTMPVISVDLHGKFVDEALETVESGIRNLPESIPGGVVVRYITGKGLHSSGGAARIKPEVLRLLADRGVPFEDRGGVVEVTLQPT